MLTVTDSTVSGNFAGSGGGLGNFGSTVIFTNVTLSGNFATDDGGGIYASGATAVGNTIVAGNTAPVATDMSGAMSSQGHNLIGDGTGGSGYSPTDLVGSMTDPIDPLLAPLQNNGGPTPTMALSPDSPALNAGDPAQLGSPEQRGVVRSGGVNIGAYQASASSFVISAPDMVTAGVPFDVTVTVVDVFGEVAVGYRGTLTFSTSDLDPGVVLPADYAFTSADGGIHTFTDTGRGETTLVTLGDQMLTVTDTADDTLTSSATVTVITGGVHADSTLAPDRQTLEETSAHHLPTSTSASANTKSNKPALPCLPSEAVWARVLAHIRL